MERFIFKHLLAWKNAPRRKPLILQGARQVGKTHALRAFGKREYENVLYVNFDEDEVTKTLFEKSLQPERILTNLRTLYDKKIEPENTLIIFDEIQECPHALSSLKYFCEQANEYHIATAGSLLGVKLKRDGKGFPVGKVNFLFMYPLAFEEFLLAIGKKNLCDFLSHVTLHEPIVQPIHDELLRWLKFYLYIGGMPEAVNEFCHSEQLSQVREVHKEIERAYLLDFAKHAPPTLAEKITTVWEMVPVQLAKENKKFVFSAIRKSARARDYEEAIQWLVDAGLVYLSRLITTPKIPLKGYTDHGAFKLFALDTGLLAAMSHLSAKTILENNHLFSEYNGAFTENYVAQVLSTNQIPLYYWKSNTAEVDFIVEHESEIYPLEVKAGLSTKKKSLLVYRDKHQPSHCARVSQFNLKQDDWLCNYPLYLIHRFPKNKGCYFKYYGTVAS